MAQQVEDLLRGTMYSNLPVAHILSMPREQLVGSLDLKSNHENISTRLVQILDQVNQMLAEGYYHQAHAVAQKAIQRVSSHQKSEARLVTFDEANTFGSWGDHALFNSQLPRLFAGYRAELIANNKKAARQGQPASADWLDKDAFQEKFGSAPWEQLSSIMETFGLNYRFAPPGERDIDPVVLFFERLDNDGTYVEFSSLSAGEKVLVILAIALLNIDPFRAAVQQPQLLLLDEIDASLHPAVLHQWMTIIQDKVVGQMGIACVMTTHSPVTVALAPEESLYEMSRADVPIAAIKKREALNKLTVGLPSMEVDFTRRRQVFVEAEVDAEAYDRLHTLMKAELQLVHSLNFLSTGIKNKQGVEQGTGCDAVKKVVGELSGFGSLSTFGLLDWDGTRSADGRIHVLAQGTHYAFDNLILNPLLVGVLLIRNGFPPAEDSPRFVGINQLEQADMQRIADAVQSRLTYPEDAPSGKEPTQFNSALTIMTDKAFCHCNGHKMEETLTAAFPSLKKYTSQRGKLALAVIDGVLGDYPSLCPMPIIEAFQKLADADP